MEVFKQKLLLVKEQSFDYEQKVTNSTEVINFIRDILKLQNEFQEVVYVLLLNNQNRIVGFSEIARRWCKLVQFFTK
ncbi:MAG: hypothetical protein HFJ30_00690 [Clostridia bacterium]|jgi:DNA repair protein RadC|nr:hypothetical protein [Clostridia bacterium]